jgi:hypothetical protein
LGTQRLNDLGQLARNGRRVGDRDGLFAGSIRGRRFSNRARHWRVGAALK